MDLGASYLGSDGVSTTRYDPTTANAMLDTAGDTRSTKCGAAPDGQDYRAAKDGTCLVINIGTTSDDPLRVGVESMIRTDLANIGINVPAAFEPNVPAAQFFAHSADGGPLATHAFDMALFTMRRRSPVSPTRIPRSWHGDCAAPASVRNSIPSTANRRHGDELQRAQRSAVDWDFDLARNSADLSTRAHDYSLADQRLAALLPAIPLYQQVIVNTYSSSCQGVVQNDLVPDFDTAAWYCTGGRLHGLVRNRSAGLRPVYSALVRDLSERALDAASAAGASYADCRIINRTVQRLTVKNGAVAAVELFEDEGIGIRVIAGGAWGFAGVDDLSGREHRGGCPPGRRIAKASSRVNRIPVRLAPAPALVGEYRTPFVRDPFGVSLDEKVDLLMRTDAAMSGVAQIRVRECSLEFVREIAISQAAKEPCIDQTIIESGGGMDATATSDDEVQTRSFPNSFGRHQVCSGWEAIEAFDLPGNAGRIAEEAVALLTAAECPAGTMTVILDATQAALQVHELCGHPTELDRVLGHEAAYAGTSFLTPDLLGTFRYGSEHVTMTADSTRAPGLGTFGWDDEGVAAQRSVLVDQGMFTGYLSSRETAAAIGQVSNGCMRADGWGRLPIIRMTNINLEAGNVEPRGDDRHHRAWRVSRDKPVVEHRRPAPQLPVRHAERLGDRRRQARPAGAKPHLQRADAGVLGFVRRRGRARRNGRCSAS